MNEECLFSISHNILILFKRHQIKLPGNKFKTNKWNTVPYMVQSYPLEFFTRYYKKNTRYAHTQYSFPVEILLFSS